ncbi:MAG: Helix-turn-helix domain [Thermoleophilaceae bacterium]|nr:Helix-turn-helix domain [Thermoleophilaceae bacterium]
MSTHIATQEQARPAFETLAVEELARRVRAGRTYAQLSVAELAERIGMGAQTIKRIESGRRAARRHEVWGIAEACGLPRAFYEVDFEFLLEKAEAVTEVLSRIDDRLARLEARGGIATERPRPVRGV